MQKTIMTTLIPNLADNRSYASAEDAFTSEGGYLAYKREPDAMPIDTVTDERTRLMAELSIHYDGRHYIFEEYRYDRLSEAVSYARLAQARAPQVNAPLRSTYGKAIESPGESDKLLMHTLHISFRAGAYEFEGYRYDRLVDAVNYARLLARRGAKAQTT